MTSSYDKLCLPRTIGDSECIDQSKLLQRKVSDNCIIKMTSNQHSRSNMSIFSRFGQGAENILTTNRISGRMSPNKFGSVNSFGSLDSLSSIDSAAPLTI